MMIVAGLFRDRDRALSALHDLNAAGFGEGAVTVVASPTSAGIVAQHAANELDRPGAGFIDLGAALGGQADLNFPKPERLTYEERVAQGDTLLAIKASDPSAAGRAEQILRAAGADRVAPGTIRD
ncbi:MAG: hypothetical protein IT305_24190 [Chloroflexi bacterium]|nr:hypothetical protein [Chloroflexota bacterium]